MSVCKKCHGLSIVPTTGRGGQSGIQTCPICHTRRMVAEKSGGVYFVPDPSGWGFRCQVEQLAAKKLAETNLALLKAWPT